MANAKRCQPGWSSSSPDAKKVKLDALATELTSEPSSPPPNLNAIQEKMETAATDSAWDLPIRTARRVSVMIDITPRTFKAKAQQDYEVSQLDDLPEELMIRMVTDTFAEDKLPAMPEHWHKDLRCVARLFKVIVSQDSRNDEVFAQTALRWVEAVRNLKTFETTVSIVGGTRLVNPPGYVDHPLMREAYSYVEAVANTSDEGIKSFLIDKSRRLHAYVKLSLASDAPIKAAVVGNTAMATASLIESLGGLLDAQWTTNKQKTRAAVIALKIQYEQLLASTNKKTFEFAVWLRRTRDIIQEIDFSRKRNDLKDNTLDEYASLFDNGNPHGPIWFKCHAIKAIEAVVEGLGGKVLLQYIQEYPTHLKPPAGHKE